VARGRKGRLEQRRKSQWPIIPMWPRRDAYKLCWRFQHRYPVPLALPDDARLPSANFDGGRVRCSSHEQSPGDDIQNLVPIGMHLAFMRRKGILRESDNSPSSSHQSAWAALACGCWSRRRDHGEYARCGRRHRRQLFCSCPAMVHLFMRPCRENRCATKWT
jgi:hypothetical protein